MASCEHPIRATREAEIATVWQQAEPADAYGARRLGGCLLVPAVRNGVIRNLLVIERDGSRQFITRGKVFGCFHLIGEPREIVAVTSSYDNAARLHDLTGWAVAVSFYDANLPHVARKCWVKHGSSRIVIVADRGCASASAAAAAVNGITLDHDLKVWP